jgi:hypothetical protein
MVEKYSRFDELAKALAEAVPRRQALRRLGGGLAGGLLASLGLGTLGAGTAWGQPQASRPGCGHACAQYHDPGNNALFATCTEVCESCKTTGGTLCLGTEAVDCCDPGEVCCQGSCCGSGQVCLSNGTCAQPCTPTANFSDPQCCNSCYPWQANPNIGFCSNIDFPSLLASPSCGLLGDSACPRGSFCTQFGFCAPVC